MVAVKQFAETVAEIAGKILFIGIAIVGSIVGIFVAVKGVKLVFAVLLSFWNA